MSEDFKFIRDFKKIDWKATLQVNAVRAEVAGILWMIITMFMGGGWNSLMYIFWPIIYFIYGLPIGLIISWLSSLGVPFIGWLGAIISATVVIGDPITSLLHKKWPDLIPVKKYDLLNWVLIIFVLEDQNDLLISDEGNIIEEGAKGTAIEVIAVPQSSMIDIDGNMYKTLQIGTQIWMAENLRVSRYKNGELIQMASKDDWIKMTEKGNGAWSYVYGKKESAPHFGFLYDWYAVNDIRKLAPEGWRIPTDNDWAILEKYLGGNDIAGGKLKIDGYEFWEQPNVTNNVTGFNAMPAGAISNDIYAFVGKLAFLWSSSHDDGISAWVRVLSNDNSMIRRSSNSMLNGASVRCIKNEI